MIPPDWQIALLDEATFLRGQILTSYAQAEFLLADLSVQFDLHFPYPMKERIKAAKKIADREGFGGYKDELLEACDKLLEFEELRHLMAHGFESMTTDPTAKHMFDFRLYVRNAKDDFEQRQYFLTIDHMRYNAENIRLYTSKAVDLFRRIYLEKRIEDPKEGVLTEPK